MKDQNERLADECLDFIRKQLSKTVGSELEALQLFADYIGSEVDGMEMRIEELKREAEDEGTNNA